MATPLVPAADGSPPVHPTTTAGFTNILPYAAVTMCRRHAHLRRRSMKVLEVRTARMEDSRLAHGADDVYYERLRSLGAASVLPD